ncbi:MAG: hypothetical protein ACYS74_17970 [Planctomycetota bacterium]|jgi:hypothetical protein
MAQSTPRNAEFSKVSSDDEGHDSAAVQAPEHAEGEINLPGLVIPVADLRAVFGMDAT